MQISTRTPKAPPTLEQQRFHFLIRQIGDARKAFSDLEKRIEAFRQLRVRKLQPVRASLTRALRETILAIDRLLDQRGWSRAEQVALRNILTGTAEVVIEVAGEDAEIKAVYNKHSNLDFDTARDEDIQRLKAETEASTGFDLGGDEGIHSEEDLVQRLYEEMAARETATRPSKRSEDTAQLATQALRELYRKLASAVHPDRESDAALREEKNELMQRINQAYAANDLLSLFEIQIEIDQLDPEQIGNLGTQRLRHYNRLLSEQLEQLRSKLNALEASAGADDEADFDDLDAQKLEMRLRRQARGLRAEVTRQEQLLRVLANKTATRRWLKQQRQFARLDDEEVED
ncbi:MAG: J domain-containing protein [Pseudomonadota bacterium]